MTIIYPEFPQYVRYMELYRALRNPERSSNLLAAEATLQEPKDFFLNLCPRCS